MFKIETLAYGMPNRNDWYIGKTNGIKTFRILTPIFQLDIGY